MDKFYQIITELWSLIDVQNFDLCSKLHFAQYHFNKWTDFDVCYKLEKVYMGHGCPRLLFLFHLQLNIGYTISEQDTIYILQTQFIATLFL